MDANVEPAQAQAQGSNGNVNITVHPLPDIDLNRQFPHMNRIACGAHKMDKLGSKDVMRARDKDNVYREMHDSVFKVLEKIWEAKNSRLNAELFYRCTGKKLIGPHRIRWLKTYDAASSIKSLFHFLY